MKCPKCSFGASDYEKLLAHVRHKHTAYESAWKNLRGKMRCYSSDLKKNFNEQAKNIIEGG